VFRVLSVLVLMRLLAQSVGLDHALGEPCDTPCEESEEGGEGCTPSCTDCVCCAHRPILTLPSMAAPTLVTPARGDFLPVTLPAESSDPREIMHVPRPGSVV